MRVRVLHIHEAPVTLCPLIYKAQRSAESVPPGPPIKFNGLSAMTSKSLAVRLLANSFPFISASNAPLPPSARVQRDARRPMLSICKVHY